MIGKILAGKYRIQSLIGTGGMAQVYKATQLSGVHRVVAVKVLKEEYENDAIFVRRFRQEAQSVLSLSHDNIVRSFDVGEQWGRHYIVLEYVEGSTLKECIRTQGPMPPRQAIQIAVQVLDALSHAHARGIIHRDVKPQNVIVTPRGRAKLTDFGIARDASASTITFAGANVLGSVHYISPEQAKGNPVTTESDIYSLGATLYEMVTGQVPFAGESPVAVALQHIEQPLEAPSARNPAVPRALNNIIRKAMDKDPARRYHSARSMRQDLLRALKTPNEDFVTQEPPMDAERMLTPRRRPPVTRGSIWRVALPVTIVIALFAVLFLMGRTLLTRSGASTSERAPNLIGKTLEDATNTAKLRSYTLEVGGWRQTDEYEPGVVISQKPDSGTALKTGSVITVIVNEGAVLPVAPDLLGLTLDEANDALALQGLGEVQAEYRVNDAPLGTIFQQEPLPQTQMLQGDTVQVLISGEPSQNLEMVGVTGLSLREALEDLQLTGFSSFRVRYASPAEPMPDQTVMLQTPAPGESVPSVRTVELTVSRAETPSYNAEIAFLIDVPEGGAHTMIVMPALLGNIPYEQVVFEAQLESGAQQSIAFTATADAGGEHTLIRYVDGVEVRRTNVTFAFSG